MKKNNLLFLLVCGTVLLLALIGLFESRALSFVTSLETRNLHFLALTTDVRLVLASISHVDIPFVSGETKEISELIEKAQDYLTYVNVISVMQILILTITKSWLFKGGLVLLFVLCVFEKTWRVSSRLLILLLALNPGLPLYTIAVQQLSKEASIDYGNSYFKELSSYTSELKSEKSKMMLEHEKNITQINNGGKGVVFFKKLKEDVSYDVHRVKTDIRGDYVYLRMLLKDGGKTIYRKMLLLCTSVFFSLFLLPVGYAIGIFFLLKYLASTSVTITSGEENTSLMTDKLKGLFGKSQKDSATDKESLKSKDSDFQNTGGQESDFNTIQTFRQLIQKHGMQNDFDPIINSLENKVTLENMPKHDNGVKKKRTFISI